MSISNLIKNFKRKTKRILFTTPTHSQGEFVIPESKKLLGEGVFKADFSEIVGLDNLNNPKEILLDIQMKASEIYSSKRTFFLTNGSTSGILALMLATLKRNDKVIVARNCHRSIYNGLVLTGAIPVWAISDYDYSWDLYKPINSRIIEQKIKDNKDAKAVIITNPTYEGLICDVEEIAKICHENNIFLFVDEAHGALYNFDMGLGTPAIIAGADASVQSLHKNAGALNPSALLHIAKNSNLETYKILNALNLINTTSPSYPLIANIENCIEFLNSKNGTKKISELIINIQRFIQKLSPIKNLKIYSQSNDLTKIVIKIEGMSGLELSEILFNEFNIEVELANARAVMCLTGIGTSNKKLNNLANALSNIAKREIKVELPKIDLMPYPQMALSPYVAQNLDSQVVELKDARGLISQEIVVPYPPGIPVLMPGEIVQDWHVNNIFDIDKIRVVVSQ